MASPPAQYQFVLVLVAEARVISVGLTDRHGPA